MVMPSQAVLHSDTHTFASVVYVANAADNEILAFVVDSANGELELVQRLRLGASVAPLAIDRDGRLLYAALRDDPPSIATLTIEPRTGKLEIVATTPIAEQMAYLGIDRSGRWLLGASYTGAAFAMYPIDDRGSVAPTATQVTRTPPHAHCIITDPTNRYLFVTSLGGDIILQYVLDAATGRAIPNDTPFVATPRGSGPRHLVFHPKADRVYVNGELDGTIAVYRLDSTGQLAEMQRVTIMPDAATDLPWGADIHITPDGRHVYACERRTSTLAHFAVDDTGRLVDRTIVSTETQPRSFAIDPGGRFLFIAGEKSHQLTSYAIDVATGELEVRGRYPVGAKPVWVSVSAAAAR